MRRAFTILALGLACTAIAFGCSSKKEYTGDPGGIDPDGKITPADNECRDLEPTSPLPACDYCQRALCCAHVLTCENSPDCKALRACITACPKDNDSCRIGCGASHVAGSNVIGPIDDCAHFACPVPCGGAIINDAGSD